MPTTTRRALSEGKARHGVFAAVCVVLTQAASILPTVSGAEISIEPAEPWSSVFADRDVTFHFLIHSTERFESSANWSLSIDGRVLARSASGVRAGPDQPGTLAVAFRLPPTKPGVVLAAALNVTIGGTNSPTSITKPVWIFPEDPFLDSRQWLDDLDIALYDPPGRTSDILTKQKVPFKRLRNPRIDGASGFGLLIVGEGVSFAEFRTLDRDLAAVAAAGIPVLCLAPVEGFIDIPGLSNVKGEPPHHLLFEQSEFITRLDKRLDARGWPDNGSVVKSRILPTVRRDRIVAEISMADAGWPWVEAEFPGDGSRLAFCGFAVIEKWEVSPTPRYLFMRMVKHLVCRDRAD